jgi:hypothetical protein
VPKDEARASVLFKQACDGGMELGCEELEALRSGQATDSTKVSSNDDGPARFFERGKAKAKFFPRRKAR